MGGYYYDGMGAGVFPPVAAAAATTGAAVYATLVLADSPVGYWKCNEGSGTTITDYGSAGKNLATTNTPALSNAGPMTGETCITLVGASNQYASVSDAASVFQQGDTFSIEWWFKRSATQGTFQLIYSKGSTVGDLVAGFQDINILYGQRRAAGGFVITSTAYTDTASWHHVVITKAGATSAVYVDGSSVTNTGSDQTLATSADTLNIGRLDAAGFYFTGSLAHVAYYATALSSVRVSAHYNARG